MENNKWEQIENHIRQYIDEKAFDKAINLLKKSAIQKQNTQLQEEIERFKKEYSAFKKKKKQGAFTVEEVQANEKDIAYALNYFIDCLRDGGARAESSASGATAEFEDVPPVSEMVEIEVAPIKQHAEPPIFEPQPSASMALPPSPPAPIPVFVKSASKPSKAKPETVGGILYNIPNKMQLGIQTRCIVRLAFDKKQLKKQDDKFTGEVIKTVRMSEVMEVDLIDISGENAFNIQFVSQKEQFIDKNEATEWIIMVKALKAGSFSLALKVAIIEKIDGKDRRKEMVLEEPVAVVSDNVAPSTEFKSGSQPFQSVGAQTLMPLGNPSVKTVLFMGANPPGTQFLQLEIEHSRISVELEGNFRFPTAKFVSASEIPKLFIIQKPNVVHFSGHGKDPSPKESATSSDNENGTRGIGLPKNYEKTGGIIVFDNDMRGMKVIEDKALDFIFSNAVKNLKIPIQIVVFNSCHSESQAKVVGKSVPYVVGTAHAIKDDIAISFAVGFYFGLANGLSVEDAFTSGKMQAVMEDLEAQNLIVLYVNGEKSVL